jgi:hypothetical protein
MQWRKAGCPWDKAFHASLADKETRIGASKRNRLQATRHKCILGYISFPIGRIHPLLRRDEELTRLAE